MKQKPSKLFHLWKLVLLVAPMLLFLFTGPLQISCGSNSLEVSPESIPAPIAKATVDLGIDSTSLIIEASSTSGVLVDLSGEILGSEEKTVALIKNGAFYKFVSTIDRRFSFPIATDDLDVDFRIVVLVSGSTEATAIASGVSEPVVTKVSFDEDEGVYFLRTAVTVSDDLNATLIDEPPLLVNQKIYVSGTDEEEQPTLFVIDLEQGAWSTILTQDFTNPPVLLRPQGSDTMRALDRETGLLQDITIDGSEVAQEPSSPSIAMPRYYSISPDAEWQVTVQRNPDSSSLFLFLSRLEDELISTDLPVVEPNMAKIECEIINADTTSQVDILVTKRLVENTYALQLYEVTTLPTSNLESQTMTPLNILNTSNEISGIDIEPKNREEALFICMNNSEVKNICLYDVNTRTTSALVSIGVNIPRAIYTTDKNIVYETSTDETTPSENKIFLFDRATNTSRFLTRGFMPSTSPTNPGIIAHLLIDSEGNIQVGVYNLNNL